jgi:hypothetical protein
LIFYFVKRMTSTGFAFSPLPSEHDAGQATQRSWELLFAGEEVNDTATNLSAFSRKRMRNLSMTQLPSNPSNAGLRQVQRATMANKRWILVGAQQAGANEKKIAEITNLPRVTVRRILSNFQRTGIPALPNRQPCKGEGAGGAALSWHRSAY